VSMCVWSSECVGVSVCVWSVGMCVCLCVSLSTLFHRALLILLTRELNFAIGVRGAYLFACLGWLTKWKGFHGGAYRSVTASYLTGGKKKRPQTKRLGQPGHLGRFKLSGPQGQ